MKAIELSIGQSILLNGKIWKLIDKMHVKPGKGGAYIQAKLKCLDNTKLEHRFSSSDTVETVMIEKKPAEFSYKEKDVYVLTDSSTYETIEIKESNLPKHTTYLMNNFAESVPHLEIEYANNEIIDIILPASIEVKVEVADPVVKGQTAASSYKNASLAGNIKIMVPPYIEAGDKIIVNLYGESGIEFVKRA